MQIKEAVQITGGLSNPSKMPGYAYNLPATACKTGGRLRKKPGTVCSKCYGCKGRYAFNKVKAALARRLEATRHPFWEDAMVVLIKSKRSKFFRWHDCGDIQSIKHLERIIGVCRRCPEVHFWMPTKEAKLLSVAKERGVRIPKNLTIRHSEPYIGQPPNPSLKRFLTSTVGSEQGFVCPVTKGDQSCDDFNCRACWSKKVKNIDYHQH